MVLIQELKPVYHSESKTFVNCLLVENADFSRKITFSAKAHFIILKNDHIHRNYSYESINHRC